MSDFGFSFDVGNNVTNMLRDVAHQLGIAVEKIYPYFVFQQVVVGIIGVVTSIIMAVAILGGSIFLFKRYLKTRKENVYDDEYVDEDTKYLKMMAYGAGSGILFAYFILTVVSFLHSHYIAMILNPQYYAIKDMLLTSHQLMHR
jgi:hypothetical protein